MSCGLLTVTYGNGLLLAAEEKRHFASKKQGDSEQAARAERSKRYFDDSNTGFDGVGIEGAKPLTSPVLLGAAKLAKQ